MHERVELAVEGPLDLAMTMGLIGMSSRDPAFRVFGRDTVAFATNTPSGAASARFTSRHETLVVDVWGGGGAHVLARAASLAGLHDRPLEFVPDHRALAALVRRFAGLRLTAGADPVEVAMHAVFGQRVTSHEARQSWSRFARRYGEAAPGPLGLIAPPRAEVVARLGRNDLLHLGLDLHRSRALTALAREADRLRATIDDVEPVSARLRTLPGIGPWTIALVRHFAYGDARAVPLDDWHIGRDLCFALSGQLRGDDARMLELLAPFAGNEGRVWRLISAAGIHHPRRAPAARRTRCSPRCGTGDSPLSLRWGDGRSIGGRMYDLIVRGGTVVDGSGLAPRRADVAVRDQRIVAVGRLQGERATRVIDAEGLIVAPGIVDVHTHYDPQITWDASCDTSVRHGVTTVVAGNCGFSIAPCRPDDHAYLAQMFARVEGMALEAFDHVRWDFETFPEFLRSREGNLGVNFGCYVGHSAVRRYVMGDASFEREASDDEITSMQAIVDDAMRGGAMGFSSAQVNLHFDNAERPVPSRLASDREINALVDVVGRFGIGSLAIAPYSTVDGLDDADCDRMIDYVKRAGVPMVFQGYGGRNRRVDPEGAWRGLQSLLERSVRERAPVYSLVMMRNSNASFHLAQGTSLYESVPLWAALMALTPQERRVAMRDLDARAAYQDAIDKPLPVQGGATTPPSWDGLRVRRTFSAANDGYERRSIQEIATAEQRRPVDVMFDIALADDLRTLFHWSNESTALRDVLRRVQFHPMVLPGISDGGAHLERDDGSEWSTYFLRLWCLDEGGWPIEAAIRRLTAVPASICGIRDRGLLQVGAFGDMMLFDPERIDIGERSLGVDRVTKTERFYSAPVGIAATIVNGEVVVENGELIEDARPGSVVRPA